MQAAIDRVMQTYGMMINLTPEQERLAREKVSSFLASAKTDDETKLAVEGLRYLRPFGRRLEQSGKKPFLKMTKDKPTATGPMTMQPSQHGEITCTFSVFRRFPLPDVRCDYRDVKSKTVRSAAVSSTLPRPPG
jgi:hypothetical protein